MPLSAERVHQHLKMSRLSSSALGEQLSVAALPAVCWSLKLMRMPAHAAGLAAEAFGVTMLARPRASARARCQSCSGRLNLSTPLSTGVWGCAWHSRQDWSQPIS